MPSDMEGRSILGLYHLGSVHALAQPSGLSTIRGMDLSELDYHLPPELIAQTPATPRDAARLLVLERASGSIQHRTFSDICDYLSPRDVVVLNDTRVRAVRLHGRRATSGGIVEVFVLEERGGARMRVLTGCKGKLQAGEKIEIGTGSHAICVRLLEKRDDGSWETEFSCDAGDVQAAYEAHARMPLPPYIRRERGHDSRDTLDAERYQTVYAAREGAVAAPTAGLHFTRALLARMEQAGIAIAPVTLHVGRGTFQPVKTARVEDHHMHAEAFELSERSADAIEAAKSGGGRVVAVGTTSTRVLESCVDGTGKLCARAGMTELMILPGYRFRAIDGLLTNFHLPKSTLLALVMAFAGEALVREAYACAIRERYRFFSYGDAMLLL